MHSRWFQLGVLAVWLAAMSWLVVTKLLPRGGRLANDQRAELPSRDQRERRVCWRIYWSEREVGRAENTSRRLDGGRAELQSVIELRKAPVGELASKLLGSWAKGLGETTTLSMRITNRLQFDEREQLASAAMNVGSLRGPPWLRITGNAQDGQFRFAVWLGESNRSQGGDEQAEQEPLYRGDVPLGKETLSLSSLTPRTRYRGLRVGQAWRTPVMQPLPGGGSIRYVEAQVVDRQFIQHDGETVSVLRIVERSEARANVTAARGVRATTWVDDQGNVLRREFEVAGLRLRFERLPAAKCNK